MNICEYSWRFCGHEVFLSPLRVVVGEDLYAKTGPPTETRSKKRKKSEKMETLMKKIRQPLIISAAALLSCTMIASQVISVFPSANRAKAEESETSKPSANVEKTISEIDGNSIDNHIADFYDTNVVQSLPDSVEDDREISVIVTYSQDTLLDAYESRTKAQPEMSLAEYAVSREGVAVSTDIAQQGKKLQSTLRKAGVSFTVGNTYDTILSGFEIVMKASEFDKANQALRGKAGLLVSEEYAKAETQIVTNEVNVYDTGIFDSSDSEYDGSGITVAVLDTGLDYTHTAFDPARFNGEEVITQQSLSKIITRLSANNTTANLTAADVYVNKKVPFAYDYADGDPDVYPLNSAHGTHVSGIIVGNDDVIMGVAPNAQLVSMKVFSDSNTGARDSWIIAALEDCVILNVDVINMSLGSASGFSRSHDKTALQAVYDSVEAQGINLVTAAGNDYNSTYGSEKNGNLGLTSNPDSAAVGSPSTFSAALSVASVSGTPAPYLLAEDGTIMYFTEASGTGSELKKFVDDILGSETEHTYEYVTIPGVGRSGDYNGLDVNGKIALVKRGSNNFEEKVRVAKAQGAIACIIYNNVSGDISMSVGQAGMNYPVCSISQINGEKLAAKESGSITVGRSLTAGPFMSNFSSWGPTADLKIKPEITAHGGDILSAYPGQHYDRISGTSMASPNHAGVTALMRQHVRELFPTYSNTQVEAVVNQLVMSTADILSNTNGLPYAVRKQGSGITNLADATATKAYIRTYDKNGDAMKRTKFELGDDAAKTGVYEMKFDIVNFGGESLSYDVGAIVMTEGVSDQLTTKGDRTVTEQGYILDGAKCTVVSIDGGTANGNSVTVGGNSTATVSVKIELSSKDKEYLDKSFANGMYVEGFLTLDATNGTSVSLSAPYLAFYGDWTKAPMFDIDYYETNADELDDSIDLLDKTLPDAYATRPVGKTYNDYIVYLGAYAFTQDLVNNTAIAASRDKISISNQDTGDSSSTVNSIYSVWAGLLRAPKVMTVTITDDVTGEVIFSRTDFDQRKSTSSGAQIYSSSVDVDFNVADYDLKNNTQYTVTLTGYLDNGEFGDLNGDGVVDESDVSLYTYSLDTNLKNTFEFPFTVDFQAPVLSGANFYTEYDRETRKTRVFVDLSIYDNHYAQGALLGNVIENDEDAEYRYSLQSFGRYITPVYSQRNSTSILTYELTDYLDEIQSSYNGNSFIIQLYDYAQNISTYEVQIPDSLRSINFPQTELKLSPNETYVLEPDVTPAGSWTQTIHYVSSDEDVVRVVNGRLFAVNSGDAVVTAYANNNEEVTARLNVHVMTSDEEGYVRYDAPEVDTFTLGGYDVNKVFYFMSSEDRDLGASEAGQRVYFTGTSSTRYLSMYPSESVTMFYDLIGYFPDETEVVFTSNNSRYVVVQENGETVSESREGTIVAVAEGTTSVTATVRVKGTNTMYTQTIRITVKDPYSVQGGYLNNYRGNGGEVVIPAEFGITQINQYAFSGYDYVPKGPDDEISEDDPYASKPAPIGDDTITKVVIPEGVEEIGPFAFAYLTALEEVVLPSTLQKIQYNAFEGCTSLKKVTFSGANNLQFINDKAFLGCEQLSEMQLSSVIAIGNSAFEGAAFTSVELPDVTQSIGARAFAENASLSEIVLKATTVKFGYEAFANDKSLVSIDFNTSVIPEGLFDGCSTLELVTLGEDVSVIAQNAFAGTRIRFFTVDPNNGHFVSEAGGQYLATTDGTLVQVAHTVTNFSPAKASEITGIGVGAFSGNENLLSVNLPNVTAVDNFAFYNCSALRNVNLGALESIGERAFYHTAITVLPALSDRLTMIGEGAFYGTQLIEVNIPDTVYMGIGGYAFAGIATLESVTIGEGVPVGEYAFAAEGEQNAYDYNTERTLSVLITEYDTSLTSVTLGDHVFLGTGAFSGASQLETVNMGSGISIGDYAFFDCSSLATLDFSSVISVGNYAFTGSANNVYLESSKSLVGTIYLQASSLREVAFGNDITSVGAYAFANNLRLASVTLGNVGIVGDAAFLNCSALTDIDLSGVNTIGSQAFALTGITHADLSNINYANGNMIYPYAFYGSALQSVVLSPRASLIGPYAFYGCTELTSVDNLVNAIGVYDYAFYGTGITEADLSNAQYIGDFAFGASALQQVTLGNSLVDLGENPFAGCAIPEFSRTVNGEVTTTFSLGDNVRVIDGVLYVSTEKALIGSAVENGLMLICYPMGKTNASFTVADGTIRIGAKAFYGNATLAAVSLPRELLAIGDQAFYGCLRLIMVEFRSIQAPILEEQYDEEFLTSQDENGIFYAYLRASMTGNITLNDGTVIEALGVVPFYSWSWSNFTNYFYGGNFIDLIGESVHKLVTLVCVRPTNGTGYENFIWDQYFDVRVTGVASPDMTTVKAIAAINAIPSVISLDDEAVIVAARAAYEAIESDEQRALVTNYTTLMGAENTLQYLKDQNKQPDDKPKPEEPVVNYVGMYVAIGVLAAVMVGLIAAVVVIRFVPKKNRNTETDTDTDEK